MPSSQIQPVKSPEKSWFTLKRTVPSAEVIESQVEEFWGTLSAPQTGVALSQALGKLGQLFKQLFRLLFLLVLLLAIGVVFLWGFAFWSGQKFRDTVEDEQPAHEQVLNGLAWFFIAPVRLIADWTIAQAKKQFGLEIEVHLPSWNAQLLPPLESQADTTEPNKLPAENNQP